MRVCAAPCTRASWLSCTPGSGSCCARLGGARPGSAPTPVHTAVTRSSMASSPSCAPATCPPSPGHELQALSLAPGHCHPDLSASRRKTNHSFRQLFSACGKRKGDLEWVGREGLVVFFGEMCSGQVGNVNLNSGGGVWGLGGCWHPYPCVGLLTKK